MYRIGQHRRKTLTIKNVVPQHQTYAVVTDELLADEECLRQAIGTRLLGIGEPHTVITAVPQQSAEHGQVHRSGDYQDIPNTGQHEYRYRIIDHGFVVNRQKLFAYPFGNRVQPRTAPSRQNNSFH